MYYNKIDMRAQHAAHAGEKKCINTKFWRKNEERDQLENCSVGRTLWTGLN